MQNILYLQTIGVWVGRLVTRVSVSIEIVDRVSHCFFIPGGTSNRQGT